MDILQIDWHQAFAPSVALPELFLRGSVVYLFLFFAFRILRRQAGAIGVSDLLAVVLIADAAQNAMASEYRSIPEGLVLVSTILFWDWALDWVAFKFPALRPLLQAGPMPLIVAGQLQWPNLDRQLLTEDDLDSQLRQHGVASAAGVTLCNLEGDGHISVLQDNRMNAESDPGRGREIR